MTALSDLNKSVRIECPGAIEPVIDHAVLKSAQDFLKRSEAWKYTMPNLLDWTTAAVFPTVSVGTDIPTATRIVRMDTVKYAGGNSTYDPIPFATRDELDRLWNDWETKTGSAPLRWTGDGPGNFRIVPKVDVNQTGVIQLRVILSLTDTATTVPDFIYYEYEDALVAGALSRLMKMPGKDWTNLRLAASHGALFESELIKAKSRSQAEYGQPVRTVTYGGI